jgi:hypothetical protein
VVEEAPAGRVYESGAQKRKGMAFRQISGGLEQEVVRSIQHRVSLLEKSPEKTKRHFRRSLITAALILDYKARNTADVEQLKAAVGGLIQLVKELTPKAPKSGVKK